MIYDCFTFFNELDILELRLNILYNHVDKFVIVEANKTHTGADKEFIFEKNKDRFVNFLDKIIYIKVDDFPSLQDSKTSADGNKWLYENYQRDAIMRGLAECKDDDIIITSDCDEIPRPEAIKEYKTGVASLVQYRFAYNYNTLYVKAPYSQSAKITRYCDLIDPKQEIKKNCLKFCEYSKYGLPTYLRFCRGKKIKNAGWHFSYVGDVNHIKQKMNAIVEQQFNATKWLDSEQILQEIDLGMDILKRGDKYVNLKISNLFPTYFIDNIEKYQKNIAKKRNITFLKAKLLFCFYKLFDKTIEGNKIIFKFFGLKFKYNKGE